MTVASGLRQRLRRASTVAGVTAASAALLVGCTGQPTSRSAVPPVESSKKSSRAATERAQVPQARPDVPQARPEVPQARPEVPQARQGRPARSSRVRFLPQLVVLPGGARAEVLPAQTVDGELKVPEQVQHVGWWDGSAYAGDPFGTTVIAGHVDSATEGIGFFARLLRVEVGDKVTVSGDGRRADYRIVSVQLVAKQALSSDGHALDQTGDHRLVLITCAGNYHRDRGGYDSNLVVTGVPIGRAR